MSNLRKEKFSFDISAMSDYVAANETDLLTKIVIGSNLAEVVSVFPNIKNAEYVQYSTQVILIQSQLQVTVLQLSVM